ncbi:hypothetical protein [Polymorphospora lycopeni]|uniref:Uncharacterized protein n=1 Tax=Polymorphospora lycopeni TaxID=3140240 RepID=A0ABV5CUP5_9ACTN
MTVRGWLLVGYVLCAVAQLVGLATFSPLLPGADTLAWALLAAYVGTGAGIRRPAVRLLLAGLLVLVLDAAWNWATAPQPGVGLQFLAPAPDAADAATEVGAFVDGLGDSWQSLLALALLIAAVVVHTRAAAPSGATPDTGAATATAAKSRRWPAPAILIAGVGAALVIGYVAVEVGARIRPVDTDRPAQLVAVALPGLLAALAAVVAAGHALAGRWPARLTARLSLGGGLVLLAAAALTMSAAAMDTWWFDHRVYDVRSGAVYRNYLVALPGTGIPFPAWALWQFAGAALIALGCVAGRRTPAAPATATGTR